MPNHTRLEQQLLTQEELALTGSSRGAELRALDDAALGRLIRDLQQAAPRASWSGEDGQVSAGDLLAGALRRARSELRKRQKPGASAAAEDRLPGAEAQPGGQRDAQTGAQAGGPPAAAAKTARRRPLTVARKPAGRKQAESRKTDLRTGSRRVSKAAAKPAADGTEPRTAALPQPKPQPKPKPLPALAETTPPPQPAAASPSTATATPPADAAKAGRKALKEAEKEARKAARKAERKAARDVEKAARKAAREAAGATGDETGGTSDPAQGKTGSGKLREGKDKTGRDKAGKGRTGRNKARPSGDA